MTGTTLEVRAHRDADTGGWWVEGDDIPGLVTEAATFDDLVERVLAVAPELLQANGRVDANVDLPIHVMGEHMATVRLDG